LRHLGVLQAALFGSAARDEAKPDSDIDILIELAPEAPIGVFEYVGCASASKWGPHLCGHQVLE
jgi:predicted nucleotidyltransferase